MASQQELAVVYAALILEDEGMPVTADKINKLLAAANVQIEPFWPGLYVKALEGLNISVRKRFNDIVRAFARTYLLSGAHRKHLKRRWQRAGCSGGASCGRGRRRWWRWSGRVEEGGEEKGGNERRERRRHGLWSFRLISSPQICYCLQVLFVVKSSPLIKMVV